MAYSVPSINKIWGWLMMGLSGGLIVPAFLRLFWWRFNGSGFAAGTFAGIGAAFLQYFMYPNMAEWLQFTTITLIGLISSIIGTYCGKSTNLGVWKPFIADPADGVVGTIAPCSNQ